MPPRSRAQRRAGTPRPPSIAEEHRPPKVLRPSSRYGESMGGIARVTLKYGCEVWRRPHGENPREEEGPARLHPPVHLEEPGVGAPRRERDRRDRREAPRGGRVEGGDRRPPEGRVRGPERPTRDREVRRPDPRREGAHAGAPRGH